MKRRISIVEHPYSSFQNSLAIKIESAGEISWIYGGVGHEISEEKANPRTAMQKSFRSHSEAKRFISERLGS